METVKMSFGQKGGLLFAFLNVLQLVGWTAIMIYDGALAIGGIFNLGHWVWCLVIGVLIILWIAVGITDLGWINKLTMAALFLLTLVLCKVIFFSGSAMAASGEAMTFGAAVELAVAMPLSWLPLISDYTREAEKPVQATWVSVLVYGLVSCWMYVIGMGAAIFTGEYDIAVIMVKAGLGIAALVILVFSTVTTTFLDAWSAGISAESLSKKLNGKKTAIAVTVIGAAGAILLPVSDRFCVCTHDRGADRGSFPSQAGSLCRGGGRPESGDLAGGLHRLPLAHGRGHPGGLHSAGYGPDRSPVRPCGKAVRRQKERLIG